MPAAPIGTNSPSVTSLAAEDLTLADLDAMSERTWQRFVTLLLTSSGYVNERGLGEHADTLPMLYRRSPSASSPLPALLPALKHAGPTLAVVTYRPTPGNTWLPRSARAHSIRQGASAAVATPVIVTTALSNQLRQADSEVSTRNLVIDRDMLAATLTHLASAYEHDQATHTADQQRRADAASGVRDQLIRALAEAGERLSPAGPSREPPAAAKASTIPSSSDGLSERAAVVAQALAALETLAEEWERSFSPTASRDGSLTLLFGVDEYVELQSRASHLSAALEQAAEALAAAEPASDRALTVWWAAVLEEAALHAQSLAARVASLDPHLWQSFAHAHDESAAQHAIELRAAAGRCALRATRLRDELAAREPNVPRANLRRMS